jgi:glycine cleavage system transcriptional repressor
MARFSLHAIGADRPGIVSAVTRTLGSIGCNLEDSRMTILHGQFAIMLIVDAPSTASGSVIESCLDEVRDELDLLIAVRPLPEHVEVADVGDVLTVSVHGADRPGIVAAFTTTLADFGGNIIDLATRSVGEGDQPGYVMVLSVALPVGHDGDELVAKLGEVADGLGVRCAVGPGDSGLL